jgi:hypothetical protein
MKKGNYASKRWEGLNLKPAQSCSTLLRMYYDFREQAVDTCRPTNTSTLSTAIAYEDFSSGVHALGTFQGLFEGNQKKFLFNMRNAWKFDFLRISELREAAIAETVRADLIIVSMRTARELPASVKWWIEAALEQREQDPGALVLLYDENLPDGSMLSPAEAYLTRCAQKADMDFFVKRPNVQPEMAQAAPLFDRGNNAYVRAAGRGMRPGCDHRRFSMTGWK